MDNILVGFLYQPMMKYLIELFEHQSFRKVPEKNSSAIEEMFEKYLKSWVATKLLPHKVDQNAD